MDSLRALFARIRAGLGLTQGPTRPMVTFAAGVLVGILGATALTAAVSTAASTRTNADAKSPATVLLTLSGEGDVVSDWFELLQGTARITVDHMGAGIFTLHLRSETALDEQPPAFTSALGGNFTPWKARATATISEPGRYRLEVHTEGKWKLTVGQ